ncbi:MAG TPA: hypothetical protein VFS35_05690 [Terrimicrobiaceae bacterium]|nr:hypothetical protein [Terrimicrobiaceae bacterium]
MNDRIFTQGKTAGFVLLPMWLASTNLEVFALHIRNLLDFFAPRSPRKTDACAAHFHKEWKSPKMNVYLREARHMADKHVAHLTTDRTSDVDLKTWAVEPIVDSLVPIIESFASGAELVCETFRQYVAERISELPPRRDWTELPPRPDFAPS